MTDLEKIELAIRRAAAQMPNHQSRAFRLVADELVRVQKGVDTVNWSYLTSYRAKTYEGD